MTEQTKTVHESIVLDRFEYKLPKGEYVVYKESSGFLYKMKHSNKEFDSEQKVLKFIEDTLKERKRYQQLVKTLSATELNKLFSDVTLLGLSPAQIKEYNVVEQFEYILVVDDEWGYAEKFNHLEDIKYAIAERFNLGFVNKFSVLDDWNKVILKGGY